MNAATLLYRPSHFTHGCRAMRAKILKVLLIRDAAAHGGLTRSIEDAYAAVVIRDGERRQSDVERLAAVRGWYDHLAESKGWRRSGDALAT